MSFNLQYAAAIQWDRITNTGTADSKTLSKKDQPGPILVYNDAHHIPFAWKSFCHDGLTQSRTSTQCSHPRTILKSVFQGIFVRLTLFHDIMWRHDVMWPGDLDLSAMTLTIKLRYSQGRYPHKILCPYIKCFGSEGVNTRMHTRTRTHTHRERQDWFQLLWLFMREVMKYLHVPQNGRNVKRLGCSGHQIRCWFSTWLLSGCLLLHESLITVHCRAALQLYTCTYTWYTNIATY